jgi:hypothetical protein
MPTSRLEGEQGRWLIGMQLNAPAWKPGDTIPRGRDSLPPTRALVGLGRRLRWWV